VGSSAYYAEVLAVRTRGGCPITTFDAQIAAVCRQYDSVLGTRNTTDFTDTGIQLVNAWTPRSKAMTSVAMSSAIRALLVTEEEGEFDRAYRQALSEAADSLELTGVLDIAGALVSAGDQLH